MHSKPFIKWAGGKRQLLDTISDRLPNMYDIDTYVEPFVGSGALLFFILCRYTNIRRVIINDLNTDLINLYHSVQSSVEALITELNTLDSEYKAKTSHEERSKYYYNIRTEYNKRNLESKDTNIRLAALFMFLNRTCFNGLYRVNSKGLFNVPFGGYINPRICDEDNLRNCSKLLEKVEIFNSDYSDCIIYASSNTFYYLDPPYKPISKTCGSSIYSPTTFDDNQQIRLKEFCDTLDGRGGKFMLSNSDLKNTDDTNTFFDDLYGKYNIHRVQAKRNINSKGDKRGKINELLITNY